MWTIGPVPNRSWDAGPIYEGVVTLLGALRTRPLGQWSKVHSPPYCQGVFRESASARVGQVLRAVTAVAT